MAKWQHPIDPNLVGDLFADHEPPRTSPHRGVDYKGGDKALISTIVDSTVVDIKYNGCLGWVCNTKVNGSSWYIAYCHLNCAKHGSYCDGSGHEDGSTCMKNLKVGDKLKAGQVTGRIGSSGRCSRGPHLHVTLGKTRTAYSYGKTYDIFKYINKQINKNKTPKPEPEQPSEPISEDKTPPKVETPKPPKPPVADDCEPSTNQGIPAKIMEAIRTILLWLKK